MANLRDHLKIEIDKGILQESFSIAKIKNIFESNGTLTIAGTKYESRHIGTYLANHSTGPDDRLGESVKRGGLKLFIKHKKRGIYSLDNDTLNLEVNE